MIKVVADVDIPFLHEVLEPYANVVYLKGKEIQRPDILDADALLVRTRTKVNRELLQGSSVKFVATATIGCDHIDTEYLKEKNVKFASAPGCNAAGVMQYVFTSLFGMAQKRGISLSGKCLGVIGVGHTGGRVAELGEHLGLRVLRNDPPKEALSENKGFYCSLEQLLNEADIISMHVPLDGTTYRMCNGEFFRRVKEGAIFINASRGEVVDDLALLEAYPKLGGLILDVWNGEPNGISTELMLMADIATPHIAGYSYEGKLNGTTMVVQAFANHFGIEDLRHFRCECTPTPYIELNRNILNTNTNYQGEISRLLMELFPIFELDRALRESPSSFEKIRSEYNYRREFRWL